MILTTSLINTSVLKAYYSLALKSIKYYIGLALGKNNTCLFKEMALLRVYIDILKNFKIVGSTTVCNCCIEGDYKVILPNDKTYYFQFSCDNTGYLVTEDNGGYDFTYCYDQPNNQLIMSFDVDYSYQSYFTLSLSNVAIPHAVLLDDLLIYFNSSITYDDFIEDFNATNTYGYYLTTEGSLTVVNKNGFFTSDNLFIFENDSVFSLKLGMLDTGPLIIKFENVDFTEECNFTYDGVFPWYYQSELDVAGTPILTSNGLITVKNPLGGNVVTPLVIPGALLATPQDVVDYWNLNRESTNFTLSYNGSEYVMESPADFVNYYSHTFNFTQSEGEVPIPGVKATASCTNDQVGDKNEDKILKAYINSSEIGSYTILSSDGFDTAAQLAVKLENTFTYAGTSSVVGANINLTAPTDGTAYNGTTYELKIITPETLPNIDAINFIDSGGNTDSFQVILQSTSQILGQVNNTGLLTLSQLALAITTSINSGTVTHGFSGQYLSFTNGFRVIPPIGSGDTYDLAIITLQCNPTLTSTIETNYNGSLVVGTRSVSYNNNGINEVITPIDSAVFTGGTNPVPANLPIVYTSEFNIIVDDELTYENLNPCTPTTVTQTCLSNDNVKKVINNINKIIK